MVASVPVVMPYYHVVSDACLPHVSGLYRYRTCAEFEEDIRFFTETFTPISLEALISSIDSGSGLPERALLLTFDDGFRECHDVIRPILLRHSVPAVFFLTTSVIDNHRLAFPQEKSLVLKALIDDPNAEKLINSVAEQGVQSAALPDALSFVRRLPFSKAKIIDSLAAMLGIDFEDYCRKAQPYLTSKQVGVLLKDGFEIGSHSVDHPLFSELPLTEQLNQVRNSVDWISNTFQVTCKSFAFPFHNLGVSAEFVSEVTGPGGLRVLFGTAGMGVQRLPRTFERFTMEHTSKAARGILARQYAKRVVSRARRF